MNQQHSSDLYFQVFEKSRLKFTEIHRLRRQDLFNKSRNLVQYGIHKTEIDDNQSCPPEQDVDDGESCSYQGSSGITFGNEQALTSIKNTNQDSKQQQPKKNKGNIKFDRKYARILQIPSWMNTVPQLLQNFYGMARPSGKTCLLVVSDNNFSLYDKAGKKISLSSICNLPYNAGKLSHTLNGTIIECILVGQQQKESPKTLFLIDCVQWKQSLITTQNFDFRYGWLMSNVGHLNGLISNTLNIRLVEYLLMDDLKNLQKIYCDNFGYEKEGLQFVQKESPYIHGYNQDVMIWKDRNTSKYPIDQHITKNQQGQQSATDNSFIYGTGKLTKNGTIISLDGYKLGSMNMSQLAAYRGGFIKYRTTGILLNAHEQTKSQMECEQSESVQKNSEEKIKLKDFEVLQFKKYGRSQPLSRIIFQYRMKYDPLTIEQIASKMKSIN